MLTDVVTLQARYVSLESKENYLTSPNQRDVNKKQRLSEMIGEI